MGRCWAVFCTRSAAVACCVIGPSQPIPGLPTLRLGFHRRPDPVKLLLGDLSINPSAGTAREIVDVEGAGVDGAGAAHAQVVGPRRQPAGVAAG